jgi:hypothetical protein
MRAYQLQIGSLDTVNFKETIFLFKFINDEIKKNFILNQFRYFKYLSTVLKSSSDAAHLLSLVSKCMNDLGRVSSRVLAESRNLLTPFDYIDHMSATNSSRLSPLTNHTYPCSNLSEESKPLSAVGSYYAARADFNAEIDEVDVGAVDSAIFEKQSVTVTSTASASSAASVDFFYYQNCVVDVLLRLFARNVGDKFALCKYLMEDLMPTNSNLIKMFVAYSTKFNGLHKTLQSVYDHLTVNAIDSPHLWVL